MKNLRISGILNLRHNILIIALIFISAASNAQDTYRHWNDYVCSRIDSLLEDEMFRSSQVGICIYDLTGDSILYRHNEIQTMRPASTQKLITAITSINTLGAHHRMYTSVSYTGSVKGKTLYGNIYCKGSFDPLLSNKCINKLAGEVKAYGIDTIQGSLYLDMSMKDSLKYGSGWCWDDENPILSPLTVNGNDYFYSDMTIALHDAGIILNTERGFAECPPQAILISSTYHTLGDIITDMLKESNNLYAEAMFYNLAASSRNKWSGRKEAAEKIEHLANLLGHDKSEYRVADGSGLSLYNYTTPKIEVDFLRYAYSFRNIFNIIYESLPIAGIDGTLKNRMIGYKNTIGNVRAKTGSLSCISSLAGYCKAANGNNIAFCIINQGILKSKKGRKFQDMVCAILCEPINTQLN